MNSMCHCDVECALYGDCCYDAAQHFATKTESGDLGYADSWQCLPLPKKDNSGNEPVGVYFSLTPSQLPTYVPAFASF